MHYYVNVIKNYVNFSGRATRQEYWIFFLINIAVSIALGIVDEIFVSSSGSSVHILSGLYTLFIFLPGFALFIRRLHDTNRSGWWILIGLIPVIGAIVLFIFTVLDSAPEINKWGVSPKYAEGKTFVQ